MVEYGYICMYIAIELIRLENIHILFYTLYNILE